MAQNERILRRVQAGIETTPGTAVAPTRKLYGEFSIAPTYETLEIDEYTGTYIGDVTFAQRLTDIRGTYTEPRATYEDLPWHMLLGVKGGVTPTSDAHATDPAYTWPFVPTGATDDMASITTEQGVPDNVYTSSGVRYTEWTLRADVDGDDAWVFETPLMGRSFAHLPAGFTAGITDRTREAIQARGTKLFIDDAGTAIGTTQVLNKFISFNITNQINRHAKRFMENVDDFSPLTGRGKLMVNGQIRLEFSDDAEYANFRQGNERNIRIEQTGTIIHAASATPSLPETRKRVRIDIERAYWQTPSDDDREGNLTKTFGFKGYLDAVAGRSERIEIVNALGTMV